MNITEFRAALLQNPESELRFVLPDGEFIPPQAHITEVGRVDKSFIDCGGTVRQQSTCLLQVWVADDIAHRFLPGKLAGVIGTAAQILRSDDLPVEIEYEACSITQYPVASATMENGVLSFHLTEKHTDCLAKETRLPGVNGVNEGCC